MSKQVTIYLSRNLTLNRPGENGTESIVLAQGRNIVDADVAAHQFVKAYTVDAGPDNSVELDELRARVADLEAQLAALSAPQEQPSVEAEAKPAKAK